MCVDDGSQTARGLCDFAKFLLDRHLVWFYNQAEPFGTRYT